MRNLASVQRISELEPIPGKDRIVLASMVKNAWKVIVRKDEFKVGDLCVYIEIDSVLPETEQFEFMRKHKFKVKTIKMANTLSQGLCMPLTILPEGKIYREGQDVTEILGVKHIEDSEEENVLTGKPKKQNFLKHLLFRCPWTRGLARKLFTKKTSDDFPAFLSKTDETRIQVIPEILQDKRLFDVTEKIDGTSATYFYRKADKKSIFSRPQFGVCSRNKHLVVDDGSPWWQVANKDNIKEILKDICKQQKDFDTMVIQGEIVGPGIQGNKYHKKEYVLYCFNLIGIKDGKQTRIKTEEAVRLMNFYELNWVPVLQVIRLPDSVDEMLELADGISVISQDNVAREGLVLRCKDDPTVSFKVVSNKYLLKQNDEDKKKEAEQEAPNDNTGES